MSMTSQTLIIFETDPKDEVTIYLRGLGLHVELNFADPGTRYKPDAMEGITGHGATREAAAQACCDRLIELLRSPAEMFDALAAGAERAAGLEWAAAERHEHKDTPLNNEAHWHVIQRSSMQTAAKLMRASITLAKPGVDLMKPDDIIERMRVCADCLEGDMQATAGALVREALARIEEDALKIAALKGEIRGLRYGIRVAQLDKDEEAPTL